MWLSPSIEHPLLSGELLELRVLKAPWIVEVLNIRYRMFKADALDANIKESSITNSC